MCLSHFPRFPVFKPSSRSCRVCVSSSTFFCFLSKFQVLEHAFFIFQDFYCFSPDSRSHTEHFSFSIFFTVFLLHISLYSVCVSFSTFFRVFFLFFFAIFTLHFTLFHVFHFSYHIPGPTVCIFHFPRF